jgi:NAD(P)-dependent dehydrogenase (short-subunit alcohol dehydrogenase family)
LSQGHRQAVAELGGIDLLVNNAAHQASFKDIGELTFRVNIHCDVLPDQGRGAAHEAGSAIINTASINFDMPNPILLAYATPKVAIQNFTAASSSFSPRRAFAPTP